MNNIYRGTETHPFHLSVGAVLINNQNEICCHYFKKFKSATDLIELEDFYVLMRETLEANETLEQAALRGISEEFGASGKIIDYIGSIKSRFKRHETPVEKTTLYFLVELVNFDLSLRMKDDEERLSEIQWQPMDYLILRMKEQSKRYERTDLDESSIIKRAKISIKKQQEVSNFRD
ncbi:MAG: NUDIX domain-containing protein [Candidatus Moranbacteria bacterium]|jgi:NADH pyrophosphatase NudC (nudix superfamily)|nr:NUDIX domain-containing protein [Candidatus Moranbacteria bacterium]